MRWRKHIPRGIVAISRCGKHTAHPVILKRPDPLASKQFSQIRCALRFVFFGKNNDLLHHTLINTRVICHQSPLAMASTTMPSPPLPDAV
jgi:hypothetical protein